MSHRWLIAVSMSAHISVAAGLFATGAWRLERMAAPHRSTELLFQRPAPPAPAAPISGAQVATVTPKTTVTKHVTQPTKKPPEKPSQRAGENVLDSDAKTGGTGEIGSIGTCTEGCEPATTAAAPVCGDGSRAITEQCDDGNTLSGDGCSATCQLELPPPPRTATVAPSVLQGLRLSGDTQVHPSASTQAMMLRDGNNRVDGNVKLCLSTTGSIASVSLVKSTRYPEYDAALLAAVHGWRYAPYRVNGAPVQACSLVRFVYQIQ